MGFSCGRRIQVLIFLAVALSILIAGCFAVVPSASPGEVTQPEIPEIEATIGFAVQATIAAMPTATPVPTPTPQPTATPRPTRRPLATQRPIPTPTLAATPSPTPPPNRQIDREARPPIQFAPFNSRFENAVPYFNVNGIYIDETGTPVFSLVFINTSGKTIDALEFEICPQNRFGEPLNHDQTGQKCLVRISNQIIAPFPFDPSNFLPLNKEQWGRFSAMYSEGGGKIEWPLMGFDVAVKAEVTLNRVHFVDGSVWKDGRLLSPAV